MSLVSRTVRVSRMAAVTTSVLALASCSGGDPASSEPLEPCTGPVTVTVSSGTIPQISWTPACTIVALLVEEGGSDRWFVSANADAGFGPVVRYGTTPAGATQSAAAMPLTAGVLYDVTLFRGTLAAPAIGANKEFTP